MTEPLICRDCLEPTRRDSAHRAHESGCDRFLNGRCICDEWVCLTCHPDRSPSPLVAALQAANAEHRERWDVV